MLRFETETGSIYEVDRDNKLIRRVVGISSGSKRIGNDGSWKKYIDISELIVGHNAVIQWGSDVELMSYYDDNTIVFPLTTTSNIVSIYDNDQLN